MKKIVMIMGCMAAFSMFGCQNKGDSTQANVAGSDGTVEIQAFQTTQEELLHCRSMAQNDRIFGNWQKIAATSDVTYFLNVTLQSGYMTVTKTCQYRDGRRARAQVQTQVAYNQFGSNVINVRQNVEHHPTWGATSVFPADCSVKLIQGNLPYRKIGQCLQIGTETNNILYFPN